MKNISDSYNIIADAGNSTIKIIHNDKYCIYDNVYAQNVYINYVGINSEEDEYLKDILNVKFISHAGEEIEESQEFVFEDFATLYKNELEERLNIDKSSDPMMTKVTVLAAVNYILEHIESDNIEENMEINISLTIGLPINEYKIRVLREKYRNSFKGKHKIEFKDPRYPVKDILVNINNVNIKMEGLSALSALTKVGEISKEKELLLDNVYYVIDIGGYCTNIVGGIIREEKQKVKLEIIDKFNKGLNYGISSAQDVAIEKIIRKYEGNVYSRFTITRKQIRDAELREGIHKNIINNKFRTNTAEFTKDEYKKLGKKIADDFAKFIYLNRDFSYRDILKKIYITGGGALNNIVVESIIQRLEFYEINKTIVEIAKSINPVYANAVGYYLD